MELTELRKQVKELSHGMYDLYHDDLNNSSLVKKRN